MVEAAERDGLLRPGSTIVESSSGNLGVALSMIAASKGYDFLCVTDSRCNLTTRRLMEALGSRVHVVVEPSPTGGLLGARLDHVRMLCAVGPAVRVAQPVHEPRRLAGALPHHRAGDRPPVPAPGRALRRRRHHRHAHGLRPVVPRVVPPRAGRRDRRRRLGHLRWRAGPADDPRPGHERAPAAARRVDRRRRGAGGGAGHRPRLPPARPVRLPVRRLHRHGRQRRGRVAGPPRHAGVHGRGDRPGPRRALPRHRLPVELAGRPVRRGRPRRP